MEVANKQSPLQAMRKRLRELKRRLRELERERDEVIAQRNQACALNAMLIQKRMDALLRGRR